MHITMVIFVKKLLSRKLLPTSLEMANTERQIEKVMRGQ